ncbi:MAG TPA: pseudouridine-5'-phosphate glycosidase [Pyrinomonadaceae bacterium]|nr:pseudouridine-5'-phosphate glycosidase [Pyrinomonadaceae bacterium]
MRDQLKLSPEVEAAIAAKHPVVALESTVIAHGLPQPKNLGTAHQLEKIIRDAPAIPATIAILDGAVYIGLSGEQLRFIAETSDIKKISMRDLPVALAQGWNGATTVATTSWLAERAGIKVFSTGGIGGVHRGDRMDVSADLPVLASTSIIVVCSGAKIVLDLPATREWLETNGVTVVGYRCEEMPAFYSLHSGLPVDVCASSPEEAAAIFRKQNDLGLNRALLVTVPVPTDFALPDAELNNVLKSALQQAEAQSIRGRDLTPFLLSSMAHTSGGATLRANIALLENNARVAAAIAGELVLQSSI